MSDVYDGYTKIKTPEGTILKVGYKGAPPSAADLQDVINQYDTLPGAQKSFATGADKPDPNDPFVGPRLVPQKPLTAQQPNTPQFFKNVGRNAKQIISDVGGYGSNLLNTAVQSAGIDEADLPENASRVAQPIKTFVRANAAIAPRAAKIQTIIARMHQIADRGTPEAAQEYAGHVAQLKAMGVPPSAYGATTPQQDSAATVDLAKQAGNFAYNNPIDAGMIALGGLGETAEGIGSAARIAEAMNAGSNAGKVARVADTVARLSHGAATGGVSEIIRAARGGTAAEEAANAASVSRALEPPSFVEQPAEGPAINRPVTRNIPADNASTPGLQAARASRPVLPPPVEAAANPLQALATAEAAIPRQGETEQSAIAQPQPAETPASKRAIARMASKAARSPVQPPVATPAITSPPEIVSDTEKAISGQPVTRLAPARPKAVKPVTAEPLAATVARSAADLQNGRSRYAPTNDDFVQATNDVIQKLKASGADTSGIESALSRLPPKLSSTGLIDDRRNAIHTAAQNRVIQEVRNVAGAQIRKIPATSKEDWQTELASVAKPDDAPTVKHNDDAIYEAETGQPLTVTGFRQNRGSGAVAGTGRFYATDPADAGGYGVKDFNSLINSTTGGDKSTLEVNRIEAKNPIVVDGGQTSLLKTLDAHGVPLTDQERKLLTSASGVIKKGKQTPGSEQGYPIFDKLANNILHDKGFDAIIYRKRGGGTEISKLETPSTPYGVNKLSPVEVQIATDKLGNIEQQLKSGEADPLNARDIIDHGSRSLAASEGEAGGSARGNSEPANPEVQPAAKPPAPRRRVSAKPAVTTAQGEAGQVAPGSTTGESAPAKVATGTENEPVSRAGAKAPVNPPTSPAQAEKTVKLPITQNEAFTVQDSLSPELRGKLSAALKSKGVGTVELTSQELGQIKIANIGSKYPNDPDVKSLKAKLSDPDISANIRKVPGAAPEPKKLASPEHQGSINNTQPVPQNFKVVVNSAGAPTIAPPKPSVLSRIGEWAKNSLLARAMAQVKHGVSPEGLSEAAGKTARLLREFGADESQFNTSRNYRGLPGEKVFDRLTKQQQLDAIDNMERGINTHASPEVQKAIDLFSQLRDEQTDRLKTLAPGLVKDFKDNYVPRVVKNPGKANPTDIYTGNTSVYGSKGFTKGRTYQYAKDTVAAGHELASYNPFTLLKLRGVEMEKAITGTRAWNAMKLDGNLKFYSNPAMAPEGWRPINNKAAEVWESRATTKADGTPGARENIKRGDWYAPDPVATVFENAHSTGFSQQPVYKLLRKATNSMNAMQLGFSGFHATTTGINSSVGKFATGMLQMEDALRAKSLPGIGKAAVTGLKGIIPGVAPAEALNIGGKMRQEFRLPGTQGQAIGESTRAMIAGGGSAASSYDHLIQQAGEMSAADKFKAGIRSKNPVQVGSAAAQLVMEAQMYPLMEQMVPRIKLAAMHDLAQAELARLPDTASADEVRKVMAKAVDSIDNRFGQVNYDNLFANKHFKDSMFLLMRAPGWKLTFREFGGSILDALSTVGRAKAGGRIITPRMAFAMSSFIVPALWGATVYALRGKSPKTVADLYKPEIDDKGTRLSLPTYVNKDLSTLKNSPGQEVINSASPLVTTAKEIITGKDYANRDIVPAKDTGLKRGADYLKYFLGRSFTPISISQSENEKGKPRKTTLQKAGNLAGVTIIPRPQPKQKASLYGAIR